MQQYIMSNHSTLQHGQQQPCLDKEQDWNYYNKIQGKLHQNKRTLTAYPWELPLVWHGYNVMTLQVIPAFVSLTLCKLPTEQNNMSIDISH